MLGCDHGVQTWGGYGQRGAHGPHGDGVRSCEEGIGGMGKVVFMGMPMSVGMVVYVII
jgi:hypothetical protein